MIHNTEETKESIESITWRNMSNSLCGFSRSTFWNLKKVNPKAFYWIVRKTVWSMNRGYPIDYPQEMKRIKIEYENHDYNEKNLKDKEKEKLSDIVEWKKRRLTYFKKYSNQNE